MKVNGQTTVHAVRYQVFALFTDPEVLARATPGVQSLVPSGEDCYEAIMKMGVAGISGTYKGRIAIVNKVAPSQLELQVSGQGTPGYIRGQGLFDFDEADGATTVKYAWNVEVGGLLAGVGQRVLGGVATMLLGQFMKALEKEAVG